MPVPGIPNNPDGINGWEGFTAEPPYGEVTNQQRLAAGAPLAGAPLASGPIQFPRAAQRTAARATTRTPQSAPAASLPPPPDHRDLWQQIAALPGVSPLALEYASRA